MNIRAKILLITILLMVSLNVLVGIVAKLVVLDSFADLENQITGEHVDRVVATIDDSLYKLESTLGDWANWDDTYAFASGLDDRYIETNMMDTTFVNLDINLMAFFDNEGSFIFGKSVDLDSGTIKPIPESSILRSFSPSPLFEGRGELSSIKGIVLFEDTPAMIAAGPILTSQREGPAAGTMVVVRFFDAPKLAQLSEIIRLPLSIRRFSDAPGQEDFRDAHEAMMAGNQRFIQTTGLSTIAGYARLDDLLGNPILLVRTEIPRDIYARGLQGVGYFLLSMLILNGILCLAFLLLLKRHVIDRLVRLGKDAALLRIQGSNSYRLETTGNDELTMFGQTLNMMLDRLKRTQEQLGKASRTEALAQLAGGTAHEFNNILGIMMGSVEMVLDRTKDDDPRKNLLANAYAAGERGREIVRQILVYGRTSQTSLAPSFLAAIVSGAFALVNSSQPPNVSMALNCAPDCPQVMANPILVEQLILNICKNAFEAIGQTPGTVELSLAPVSFPFVSPHLPDVPIGDYLRLSIRDTGEGMSSSVMEHIFEPFFSTKEVGKGTGLGLSVARGIMQQHGGWIGATSGPLEGTTFDMIFPLIAEKTDQDGSILMEAYPSDDSGSMKDSMEPARLLFIENTPEHYELAIIGFGKLDFQVTVAPSGRKALALIQDRPDSFSLALVDTGIEDPGWAELCRALAKAAPRLPLILCHSPRDRIDAALAGSMGIREFVRKPPSLRLLLQTVQSVLEYSRIEKLQ